MPKRRDRGACRSLVCPFRGNQGPRRRSIRFCHRGYPASTEPQLHQPRRTRSLVPWPGMRRILVLTSSFGASALLHLWSNAAVRRRRRPRLSVPSDPRFGRGGNEARASSTSRRRMDDRSNAETFDGQSSTVDGFAMHGSDNRLPFSPLRALDAPSPTWADEGTENPSPFGGGLQ